jgi:hypothetical protein
MKILVEFSNKSVNNGIPFDREPGHSYGPDDRHDTQNRANNIPHTEENRMPLFIECPGTKVEEAISSITSFHIAIGLP